MGVQKNKRVELVPGIQLFPGKIAAGSLVKADTDAKSLVDGGIGFVHAVYDFSVDGGAVGAITPAGTASIPANAIIVAATINVTTAVTSGGAATVSVGTTAGSGAASLLAATAKTSLTVDALLNSAATFAAPVKMTAAGSINITVGTAALTAGVIEIFVFYVQAKNA